MNFISALNELDKVYEVEERKVARNSRKLKESKDTKRIVSKETDKLCSVDLDGQQMFVGTEEECQDWVKKHQVKGSHKMTIKNSAEINTVESLHEEADEEILVDDEPIVNDESIVDDEVAVVDEPVEADDSETVDVKDYVLECSKCGALVIKAIKEVTEDEESGLVNVGEECAYCEASDGFKILGTFAPYEEKASEEDSEEDSNDEEELEELFDANVSLDARGFGGSGNDVSVLSTGLGESLDEEDEELEELFNANLDIDARGFGGTGNTVGIL